MYQKHNIKLTGNLNSQKTLVFANGFGSDQQVWRHIIPSFKDEFRIVLFDLPNSNLTSNQEFDKLKYDSLHDYAEDFIDILDHLNIENAVLVGHSVSCMIGALTALKKPELIDKLIFISASPCYLNKGDYPGGLTTQKTVEILSEMADNYTGWIKKYSPIVMNNPDKPHLSEEFSSCLTKLRPDISILVFNTILKSDYRREVARLEIPVLILQPRDDVFVPVAVGEYLHKAIKNSEYRLIEALGHFPHLSNPSLVVQEINDFLNFPETFNEIFC
ncbi:MAG: Sigma factor SigB regulation protein RsbQ [Chroococcopsis gigantea SAG 12.99]|jgi:sigma-B regulation protein RsbQ|nr:Sigma factor SigB regulation protein RsbQ [Chroococcopsis gigantea SAG 12.99]